MLAETVRTQDDRFQRRRGVFSRGAKVVFSRSKSTFFRSPHPKNRTGGGPSRKWKMWLGGIYRLDVPYKPIKVV